MGLRHVHSLVNGYRSCEYVFHKRDAVRSRKWQENWRPLVNHRTATRYDTCRLEKYDTHYAVVLHKTTLLKFFTPRNGYERVEVYLPRRWDTQSTRLVLSQAGWAWKRDGISICGSKEPDGLSAVFVYYNGDLMLEHSYQLQLYKQRSTQQDKEAREKLMAILEPIMTMADIWFQDEVAHYELLRKRSRRFTTLPKVSGSRMYHADVAELLHAFETGTDAESQTLHKLQETCRRIVSSAYELTYSSAAGGFISQVKEAPKLGALRSKLRTDIVRAFGIDKGTGREYINKGEPIKGAVYCTGQFPEGVDPRTDCVGALAPTEA